MGFSLYGIVLDGPTDLTWPAIAGGVLVTVLGGLFLGWFQRREDERNKAEAAKDKAEADERAAERAAIQSAVTTLAQKLDGVGLALEAEKEERARDIGTEITNRMAAINDEAVARRDKDESLGRDIGAVREEIAYQAGQSGKERPKFNRSKT